MTKAHFGGQAARRTVTLRHRRVRESEPRSMLCGGQGARLPRHGGRARRGIKTSGERVSISANLSKCVHAVDREKPRHAKMRQYGERKHVARRVCACARSGEGEWRVCRIRDSRDVYRSEL